MLGSAQEGRRCLQFFYHNLCRFSPDASSHFGEDQLEQLLQDASIDAVIIVLPVQIMLKVSDCCYDIQYSGSLLSYIHNRWQYKL